MKEHLPYYGTPLNPYTVIENYASPGCSGELETSPLRGFACGARPRCTLGRFAPSDRLTGRYRTTGLADPSLKLPSATSNIRQTLYAIGRFKMIQILR